MLQTNMIHQFLTPTLFTLQSYHFFNPRKQIKYLPCRIRPRFILFWAIVSLKHTVEEEV